MDYILTHKGRIFEKYGAKPGKKILALIERLEKVKGGCTCFIDEHEGIFKEAQGKEAGEALAFRALLDSLSQDTTRVHTFLFIGGHDLVPFHEIPNPTHDEDGTIMSDAPSASREGDFLIPQRSVGRIPDTEDGNEDLLGTVLEGTIRYHEGEKGFQESFGYSASIWAKASRAVFQVIGDPDAVRFSPPLTSEELQQEWLRRQVLYFNLHGSKETPNWYGQRSPDDPPAFSEFPVAISPENVPLLERSCVYSEACYGAWVTGKEQDESLALTFMARGSVAFVGSTAIAYGPIEPPSGEADLLGTYFFNYVLRGIPFGECLRQAKIDFARTMIRRQGFLDSDDKKTLIEFHLYGDPSLALFQGQ
jgi:hypothetical protein